MKKVYLVHGWGGSPDSEGWFAWLRAELEKKGFSLEVPRMPNTDKPEINAWVNKLKETVKDTNEETYFIGHSIGCQGVLRFLETLNSETKIGGVILVAPWIHLDENTIKEEGEEVTEIAKPWIETLIDFEKIKKHTNNFVCIFSDNDPYVPLSDSDLFKEKLNAKVIIKHNEGHFNDTQEIKEIMEFAEKWQD